MMIDADRLITLAQAAKLAPGRPHATSLWRAARKGVRAANGERVFLEHVRFGRRLFTSREAVARFGRELAEADREHFARKMEPRNTPKPRSATQRAKALARADAELRGLGV